MLPLMSLPTIFSSTYSLCGISPWLISAQSPHISNTLLLHSLLSPVAPPSPLPSLSTVNPMGQLIPGMQNKTCHRLTFSTIFTSPSNRGPQESMELEAVGLTVSGCSSRVPVALPAALCSSILAWEASSLKGCLSPWPLVAFMFLSHLRAAVCGTPLYLYHLVSPCSLKGQLFPFAAGLCAYTITCAAPLYTLSPCVAFKFIQ